MKSHWYYLRANELLKLGLLYIVLNIKCALGYLFNIGIFCSVRSVYKYFGIKYFEVEYDINQKKYINAIKYVKPDVIVSSNSLFFKEEILNIPTKCCINRHSSLLPSYGGLWPVFQACRNGEKFVGVSVHTMGNSIDNGIILGQKKISVKESDTVYKLYQKCFNISADVVLGALKRIKNNDYVPKNTLYSPSYFSFPKKVHWKEFRNRNKRFI